MCDDEKPPCKQIETIHKFTTEFNADSVEWCPHEPHFFVCANYQLKDGVRFGRILLFSVTEELNLLQTIETAGVLDQKWCHNQINGCSILGVVNALKTLEIYSLHNGKLELVTKCTIVDDDTETLFLSLDWSTGKFNSEEPEIVCSDSKGKIHKFKFTQNELVKVANYDGHNFEAWISCFYYWDTNVFFSGGDDCWFLKFDTRTGDLPVGRNRSHEAGVTSMHSNSKKEYLLATGSYDCCVRLWDTRFLKACTNVIKMPGTLWRLKWEPKQCEHLLAACMLGGIHVINARNSDKLEICDSYYEHKDISYGADWSFQNDLLASCSFYDNLLCISKIKLDF